MSLSPHRSASVVAVFACVVGVAGVSAVGCAGAPAKDAPDGHDGGALAGCQLMAGPVALCDGGAVIVDVGHAPGAPADRIAVVHEATDRPDDVFQLTPGTPAIAKDGSVSRTDVVHPWRGAARVGSVSFYAPNDGDVVVSCAAFGSGDGQCARRARALLTATVPAGATIQRRPSLTLPPDDCEAGDEPLALQRLCKGGEKLSVVAIDGHFGPAAGWWLFHRVVQTLATSVRLFTSCNVLSQLGNCAIVTVGAQPVLFGMTLERKELRIAGCFFPGETTGGVPAGCLSAFPAGPPSPDSRLLSVSDVPYVGGCALTQPDEDGFSRSIAYDDGPLVAQFDDPAAATALVDALAHGAPVTRDTVACVVRGAPASCTRTTAGTTVSWRADVADARVAAFVCSDRAPTPPALCHGFIDVAP